MQKNIQISKYPNYKNILNVIFARSPFTDHRSRITRESTGFTIIELLVVMGIIGILSTVLIVSVNPVRQFAKARDTDREADVVAILSIIYQYASEHSGEFPDTDGDPATSDFPTSLTCIGTDLACFDLAGAGATGDEIVPAYVVDFPKDPKVTSTGVPGTDGDTGYQVMVDANGHLTATAPSAETKTISTSR